MEKTSRPTSINDKENIIRKTELILFLIIFPYLLFNILILYSTPAAAIIKTTTTYVAAQEPNM
jgi:hypothetical protein